LHIRIMFGSPAGEKTEGPEIVVDETSYEPRRDSDDASWDKSRCIQEFRGFLEKRNDHGLEAAMRALDRLDCWHDALGQLLTDASPNEDLGRALQHFWISYGFHIASSLKGDSILVDAFKYLLPPYKGPTLRLYRGELRSRHLQRVYGISWTPKLGVATMFADRRCNAEGLGVVLEIEATPDMVAAAPDEHSYWLREEEYIIDTRLIHRVRVITQPPLGH
jgi:hypothetical protein